MKITYKNLINEWFAHLDKGYATPPYTDEELSILEMLCNRYQIITEEEKDTKKSEPEPEDSTSEDRFVAKTALFMQSPDAFAEYIITNYSNGIIIENLDGVFTELSKLDADTFQDVVKILNSGTDRKMSNGTFSMGKYEKILRNILKSNVRLSNGDPDHLFLAIVFGGKVSGSGLESMDRLGIDIEFDDAKGIVFRNFQTANAYSLGAIPSEAIELLDNILQLSDIVSDVQTDADMSREYLNTVFKMLSDPAITDEINKIRTMNQTSDVKAMRKISNTIDIILGEKTPDTLVVTFLNLLDEHVRKTISVIGYWATINSEIGTVYLEPTSDIYDILKSDLENKRLSRAILDLNEYRLNIKSASINKKLMA